MAEPKTRPTKASVTQFIAGVSPERRRHDALAVSKLMRRASGEAPTMWGANIVGYGRYSKRYANGSALDWPLVAFSPRKASLVLYVLSGFPRYAALVAKLGRIKVHGGCLYVTNLAGVNTEMLERLVRESVEAVRKRHAVGKTPARKIAPKPVGKSPPP